MHHIRSQLAVTITALLITETAVVPLARSIDTAVEVQNESGVSRTINIAGFPVVAESNEFFLVLGVNGRRCVTCHEPAANMSVTPESLQKRFENTHGMDAIFRLNDGANTPLADVSSVGARRDAYSMLLRKGVIRVGIGIPADAEFELLDVKDPYGYAGNNANGNELSLFRRVLPSTNLAFLSTVMWDGRETLRKGDANAIHFDLAHQANAATQGHAEAPLPISARARDAIVAYELGLFTAQVRDKRAGALTASGARGGPDILATQPFVFGSNDPLGCDPRGEACTGANSAFDSIVFTIYDAWTGAAGRSREKARAAVARGQVLFNTRPITITGVSGINDDFGVAAVTGTCTTCHDTANAGNHSVPAPLNIGIAEPPIPTDAQGNGVHNQWGLSVGDMPVYTLRRTVPPGSMEIKVVTDPGRALITGKWADVGRFKGPTLRGLSGRAPYFHNGSASTLREVIEFYDKRFEMKLSEDEKADLVAFLRAL
jgi:cytochrome c peroxidase